MSKHALLAAGSVIVRTFVIVGGVASEGLTATDGPAFSDRDLSAAHRDDDIPGIGRIRDPERVAPYLRVGQRDPVTSRKERRRIRHVKLLL